MKRIAITGGIACGKSLFAKYLNEVGIETLDADFVVHKLLPEDERRKLSMQIFASNDDLLAKRLLSDLEARLHPKVKVQLEEFLALPPSKGYDFRAVIIPLLFEVHWDVDYDIICSVVSDEKLQVERMTEIRGYTVNETKKRLSVQLPIKEKASRSHFVVYNDSTPEHLQQEAVRFKNWLKDIING